MPVSASVVLYNTCKSDVDVIYGDVLKSEPDIRLFFIDNSPKPCIDPADYEQAVYKHAGKNLGYGSGHNVALALAREQGSDFHFVLNPDIHFKPSTLPSMLEYMKLHEDVGCMMPRVLNTDGSTQRLCRLLPTPMDLIGRRFLQRLLPGYISRRNERYELAFWNYDSIEEVPVVSGCFLLLRMSVLDIVGRFDESFFMYLEDYDLVRRAAQVSKTVFYPRAEVTHAHAKMSYKTIRATMMHIRSAIQYFNKWGWIFDVQRKNINHKILRQLQQ